MTKRPYFSLSTVAVCALAAWAPHVAAAWQVALPAAPPASHPALAAPGPAVAAPGTAVPPVAAVHPYEVKSPNGSRTDDYYWLRDDRREKPEVLAYLAAENAYTDAMMAHTRAEQDLLFSELLGRVKQDDSTVPTRKNGYWYYRRFETGKEYPIYARRKGSSTASEQVILDGNALAAGHGFFQAAGLEVTRDGKLLAYGEDVVGRRQYVLKFKNLESGETLGDTIPGVSASFAWANDGRTLLYVENDPVTLLGYRVRKHLLGTDPKTDPQVYEEKDHSFYLRLEKSPSDRFLFIALRSTVSTEWRVASADDPRLAFHVLLPRERDHEYEARDLGDDWILRTNWQAPNFRIVRVPMARVGDRGAWRDVVPARTDAFVDDFVALEGYLAVGERSDGLRKIRIKRWSDGKESLIAADEPTFTFLLGENPEQGSTTLRYVYTSLTTPRSDYDLDLETGTKKLLKREAVLGGFEPASYASEYVWAPARDGKRIPVSIAYRKGFRRGSGAPLLQLGYGSYGLANDPTFNPNNLSLLDRGFVLAVAHVRGGQELGRAWYEDGKLLHKQNTFNDFVDVTRFLVAQGYAARDRVFALGGSAGGLLMGAVVNQCPECYRGVLAMVPFVDVVTTMLDESIPLTSNEFDEWGNPKEKSYYAYMLSYSPYDNVERKAYPAMMVSTGLWDSQVQYYEPAKWVAKLRARKTDANPLFFHVNMEAGHGGKSGRFQRLHEIALYDAFLFDLLGRDLAAEAKRGGTQPGTSGAGSPGRPPG
ncbi:MAG TPA: S9 family peptidase [Thermoanaerobaculia bacterium]|nr:S9 family peptidase [Thermoanaerobaculia bacterium]